MNQSNDQDFEEIAGIAKALSHPVRIKIMKILTEKKMCICGEIVDLLPLSQSTVSQHLKELKRAGLIKGEIDGPKTCYCINEKRLAQAFAKISGLFNKTFKCC